MLHDAIGITQQSIAGNDAYEAVQRHLDKKDDKGIENQRKVLVRRRFIDVKQRFRIHSAAPEAQHYIDIERARSMTRALAAGRSWILNDDERERWDNEAGQYTQFEDTLRAKMQAKLIAVSTGVDSTANTCRLQTLDKR